MSLNYLGKIKDYRDLRHLKHTEKSRLCNEIRQMIIDVATENGGHLASSLGTVELTVALLSVYDPLEDKIVFDVGHQCYTYKILTGRKDRFNTLRQWEGISGFPKERKAPSITLTPAMQVRPFQQRWDMPSLAIFCAKNMKSLL